jgi:hypothetical protein
VARKLKSTNPWKDVWHCREACISGGGGTDLRQGDILGYVEVVIINHEGNKEMKYKCLVKRRLLFCACNLLHSLPDSKESPTEDRLQDAGRGSTGRYCSLRLLGQAPRRAVGRGALHAHTRCFVQHVHGWLACCQQMDCESCMHARANRQPDALTACSLV